MLSKPAGRILTEAAHGSSREASAPWTALAAAAVLALCGPSWASRERLPTTIGFTNSGSRQIWFPADFSFPIGGVPYKSCFITANGLITFHVSVTSSPTSSSLTTFLGGRPMIAPLWVDLDPSLGGTVTAGRIGPTEFEFRWENVRAAGNAGALNNVRCVLVSDGSFRFEYGTLTPTPSASTAVAIIGFSTGNANTLGAGMAVSLGTQTCPSVWGTGNEPAIYEVFNPPSGAAILSGQTLCFAPTLPTSGKLSLSDDDTVEVAIDGWAFTLHGNPYTSFWVNSNGSVTFGGRDTDYTPTAPEFLNRWGRIAGLWTDLNPGTNGVGRAGSVSVAQGIGVVIVSWNNVPYFGQAATANNFSISFQSDGTFAVAYGTVSRTAPTTSATVLVGQTGGYPMTSGGETSTPFTPPGPLPSGAGAQFDLSPVSAFPYQNTTIAWDSAHLSNVSALPLGNTECVEVPFPPGFAFPMAGVSYASAFIHSDGYLSFGGTDLDATETTAELLSLFPRIAMAWDDLNPSPSATAGGPEGAISISAVGGSVSVRYQNVFESPTTGSNNFSIVLNRDGSFAITYQGMTLQDCIVGYSAGGGKTTGTEAPVNLSSNGNWGTGTETAIFEAFTAGFDLANTTLVFAGAGPILYQGTIRSPGTLPVAIGAGPAGGGLTYVIAGSLGTVPGIPVAPCGATIPLNLDGLLAISLLGQFLWPFTGALDGWGQLDGWPLTTSSPLQAVVPGNLSGRGFVAHLAFVAIGPPGTPCRLAAISPPAPFAIP